jgi:hypothetical protein
MLTEKSEQEFNKWLYSVYFKEYYQYQMIWQLMGETARNAVIIEWFDSVGLKIQIVPTMYIDVWHSDIPSYTDCESENEESRNKATTEAITKANEIFNNT